MMKHKKAVIHKFNRGMKQITALCLAGVLAFVPGLRVEAVGAGSSIARGIDVSKHNLGIDWSQVPASGVSFAFVKAGSTNSGVDPYFDVNMRGANAAGLRTGVYLYSYATNVEEARNEANQLMQWIGNYTVSYPVVYDVEAPCHKNMSQAQLQEMIHAFCSIVEANGYYPVVYSSRNMFRDKIGNIGYDKWVAQYADALEYDGGAAFWQHTSHGSVAGIPTRVDMNYQFKDYSSVIVANGFAARGDQTVFYADYRMQRNGWVNWEDNKYHLDESGFVQKGCWFEDETGRYFLATEDGHALRDAVTIEGQDYYFDANGVMQRGLVTRSDGNVCYYDPATGAMQRNVALTIEGQDYYFDANGVMQRGLVTRSDGNVCYYDPATGAMQRNAAVTVEGQDYYIDANGVMQRGLVTRPDGNVCYYDPATGAMQRNVTVTVDGINYTVDGNGVATVEVIEEPAEETPVPEAGAEAPSAAVQ